MRHYRIPTFTPSWYYSNLKEPCSSIMEIRNEWRDRNHEARWPTQCTRKRTPIVSTHHHRQRT